MGIPLSMQVYERGAAGVPTTTFVTDLAERADSYAHTISDRYGFESARVVFVCSFDEAIDWLRNGLMRSLIVSGPDAETCWEGFLETITVTVGQKKASLSLKNMANHVVMIYTTGGGAPGEAIVPTSTASLSSQAQYGRKDYLGALSGVTLDRAQDAGAKTLAQACQPRSAASSRAGTGDLGDITIELSFAGWYATLDWNIVSNSSGSLTATNTQLSTVWLPSIATINAFLSTNYSGITFTGPLWPQYVAHYKTYKQVIDAQLTVGDSSNNALAFGVLENRRFQAVTSAEATPTVITYQEDVGSGQVFDMNGAVVAPWNVRPNTMSEIPQLLDVGPGVGAVDATARKYVARVTCDISSNGAACVLEPSGTSELDAIAALFPTTSYGS